MIKIKKMAQELFCSEKNKFLLGTISEGDIHAALIQNSSLDSSIKTIFNKNPKKVILGNYNLNKVSKIFLDKQIGIIPVVDSNNIVKKIISWNDIFGSKKNYNELKKLKLL